MVSLLNEKQSQNYSRIEENEYESSIHKDKDGQLVMYRVAKGIKYPAIVINVEKIQGYLAKLIKSIMKPKAEGDDLLYNVYIVSGDTTVRIGQSTSVVLRILLDSDMFKEWKVTAYLNESKVIEGEMLYALC